MSFPTKEQLTVIKHRGRPLVVVAGPGTGKTKTIVQRMIDLLNEDPARNITFVTFTRTSRADTSCKLSKSLNQSTLTQPNLITPRVGTLHATAKSLIHRLGGRIGLNPDFTILITDKSERDLIIEEVAADLNINISPLDLSEAITYYLCNLCPMDKLKIAKEEFLTAFRHYESLLRFYVALGMEEIVFYGCKTLEKSPKEIPPIFLQVDEFQDLNPADQHFIRLVASNEQSQVIVVGDDAQSIYKFRYANYRGLRDLWDSPDWEHVPLKDCFRLPAHIQRAALALIENEDYLGATMNVKPDNGRRVPTYQCTKSKYQSLIISRCILEFMRQRTKDNGEPIHFADIMILCPSGKFIPGVIETLRQHGIPSKDVSRMEIPEAIWRLILIIRIAFHRDNVACREWLDVAGIPVELITEIRYTAMEAETTLLDFAASSAYEELHTILIGAGCLREASNSVDELVAALLHFPHIGLTDSAIREVVGYLLDENGSLLPSSNWLSILFQKFGVLEDERETTEEDAVLVTSLHSAKGLEAELVCLMWMNERYMPMPNRDPAEERRLLYVGLTRAKQDLIITFHEQFEEGRGYLKREALSPFLQQIVDHLNITRVRAEDLR